MAFWRLKKIIFTVGGYNGSRLKKVQEYCLSKNTWAFHSDLPEAIHASSAVVLSSTIYNIGG